MLHIKHILNCISYKCGHYNPNTHILVFLTFTQDSSHISKSKSVAWAAVRSKTVVLLLLTFCLLLFPLWESVIVQCFLVCYFMSILVLQSSWWGRERASCFTLFVFLASHDGWAALPRGATGLSGVCDYGISWSYSLTFFDIYTPMAESVQKMSNIYRNMKELFTLQHAIQPVFNYFNIDLWLQSHTLNTDNFTQS